MRIALRFRFSTLAIGCLHNPPLEGRPLGDLMPGRWSAMLFFVSGIMIVGFYPRVEGKFSMFFTYFGSRISFTDR